MADPNKLHTADPKPENPIQFIRKRLSDPIDAEEFRCMKQSLGKLNEDMGQMKADVTKISNIVSKLLPNHATDVDQNVNVSVPSMENNVGDSSHISMLDDSSLIFDQTNDDDLNSTMHIGDEPHLNCSDTDAVDSSQSKDAIDDSAEGFTLEIVEVDVVNKSSIDLSIDEKAIEEMQVDDSILEELAMTSTPETTAITEPTTDANLAEPCVNIDELPIVFKEEDSEEPLTLSQGFRGFDSLDVHESKMHLPGTKIDEPHGEETLTEEPGTEMVVETSEVHDEPKIEQVESPKSHATETTEVDIANASQDVATIGSEIPTENEAPIETKTAIETKASIGLKATVETGTLIESEVPATDPIDEIVEGILSKVEDVMEIGEIVAEAVIARADGSNIATNEVAESLDETGGDGCAVVCIAMPKDDPETQLFLSYS
ncbi:uncharacterized protein LOC129569555 isoform X2 [Sitodiplosis mosellana]|uniref:uncharacterized protein LOC129569555 isoform X2 n=1 Tax=Sitodiplosis mosellana TaxID=263140 RepID=UPI002443E6D5|nr:uncharacterized protein LOC129569555 isoform X2 [Sitodiplosis mosellana]